MAKRKRIIKKQAKKIYQPKPDKRKLRRAKRRQQQVPPLSSKGASTRARKAPKVVHRGDLSNNQIAGLLDKLKAYNSEDERFLNIMELQSIPSWQQQGEEYIKLFNFIREEYNNIIGNIDKVSEDLAQTVGSKSFVETDTFRAVSDDFQDILRIARLISDGMKMNTEDHTLLLKYYNRMHRLAGYSTFKRETREKLLNYREAENELIRDTWKRSGSRSTFEEFRTQFFRTFKDLTAKYGLDSGQVQSALLTGDYNFSDPNIASKIIENFGLKVKEAEDIANEKKERAKSMARFRIIAESQNPEIEVEQEQRSDSRRLSNVELAEKLGISEEEFNQQENKNNARKRNILVSFKGLFAGDENDSKMESAIISFRNSAGQDATGRLKNTSLDKLQQFVDNYGSEESSGFESSISSPFSDFELDLSDTWDDV